MRPFRIRRGASKKHCGHRVSSFDLATSRRREKLCVERIKTIHRYVMELSGDPDSSSFEDAMYSEGVLQGMCQLGDWINDPFLYAAEAMERIATIHPFIDGNKRTAFVVASVILADRGIVLEDTEDVAEFVIGVATGKTHVEEIAHWLRKKSNHSPRRAMT